MARLCIWDDVSMKINVLEVVKSLETLDPSDSILREVDGYQILKV